MSVNYTKPDYSIYGNLMIIIIIIILDFRFN